ncbi:MAG: phosphodiesterase [Rhodospirillales bacterium]|nr:phosphodiesterase [Rhodospirillales bacterium]
MLLAQLTDLHLRPPGMPADRVVETNMLAERAFRAVRRLTPAPDAVVLSGDLVDTGSPAEYDVLVTLLRRYLRCPVFAIPGNHDRRENFRAALADLPGVTEDAEFVQYAVEEYPVRLVMLDTVVPGAPHGELCARRHEWLERTLAAETEKPTIVVMHHPPFDSGIGHMDAMKLRDAEAFVAVMERHRQVQRILCGHVHRAVTARVAHAIASIAPSMAHQVALDLAPSAPSALVMEPAAFQLHHVTPAREIVSHTAYVEEYPGPFPFLTPAVTAA